MQLLVCLYFEFTAERPSFLSGLIFFFFFRLEMDRNWINIMVKQMEKFNGASEY